LKSIEPTQFTRKTLSLLCTEAWGHLPEADFKSLFRRSLINKFLKISRYERTQKRGGKGLTVTVDISGVDPEAHADLGYRLGLEHLNEILSENAKQTLSAVTSNTSMSSARKLSGLTYKIFNKSRKEIIQKVKG